jgi:alpha-1,6-mannosyltransferase
MLVEDQTVSPESGHPEPASRATRLSLTAVWGWGLLGLVGSALSAYAGTRLLGEGKAIRWWFQAPWPSTHDPAKIVFWAGVVALCGAWLGLGRSLRRSPAVSLKALWIVGAVWCLPFLLGPPLFSRDVYSYIAQGTLVHLGHSPYHDLPTALGHLGQRHVLDGVDPFWRRTTAPYGPLFLGVVSLIVGVAGSHLVLDVVLVRLFDVIGIVLLAVFVPRLARALGGEPRRALWLAMLSPLVWLQLVSPAHNDALMVGLMVAGVAFAVERQPLLGIAVCAVAATVKVPAAAAIVFIAVAWARGLPDRQDQLKAIGKAALVTVGVAAIVTAVTGLGVAWISTGLFNTPGRVRLAVTPATAVGYTIAHALHGLGVPLNGKKFEATLSHVAFAITAVIGILLLYRTRWENMVRRLGWLLLAVAIFGPATWPWYFTWGLALLAASPGIQFSRVIPLAVVASAFLVMPTGQLALSLGTSPQMVVFYLLVLAVAIWYWVRRLPRGAASMLANP